MKIVLGGSRHLELISGEVQQYLAEWMDGSCDFLVGDAPGIDRTFQLFLKSKKYTRVTVYTSAEEIRNNLGNWPIEKIESGLKSKSSAVPAFKDRKMSKIADMGMMIWDCKSAGTLGNVIDLTRNEKKCFLWVAPDSELCSFDNYESLEKWMSSYPEVRDEAISRLNTFEKREKKRSTIEEQPNLFE